jgi:serine/threonine-protein kinase
MNGLPDRLKSALADRYTIERELGSGGMATVYLAEDLKHHRRVAIKVLKPELAHAVGADRFLREIRITAGLNHPHILPLLDSGEADGFLYFVMPYVAGESLRARMDREGPLPIDEALRIAEQVASALEHAHRQEVIHRDVKPENILLHEGAAMVADFGIAVAVSAAGGERLTETGIAVGTPAFMSPEQAIGDEAIDERSDIYSLACVLYEMLGGEAPHVGETPRAIMAQKLVGDVRSIRELRPEADEALEAVLARALEAAPEDRFATAGEFGEALRSPEVGWTIAAQRLRARRRKVVAAAAAGLVVVVLAVGAVLQYVRGQAEPTRLVVLPFEYLGAAEDEYLAEEITEELRSRLRAVSALDVIARWSSVQYKLTDKTIGEIGAELDVEYVLGGTIRWDRSAQGEAQVRITPELVGVSDATQLWTNPYQASLADIIQLQVDIVLQVVEALEVILQPEDETRLAHVRPVDPQAHEAYLKGNHFLNLFTVEGLQKATDYFAEAVSIDPGYASAYAGLARSYLVRGQPWGDLRPVEAFPLAREAAEEALSRDSTLGEAHSTLGHIRFLFDWDWSGAEAELKRGIELSPNSSWAYEWYANFLRAMWRSDEALEYAERAVELDPLSPLYVAELAIIYGEVGQPERAREKIVEALELDPNNPVALFVSALLYAHNGMLVEAIQEGEKAAAAAPYSMGWLAFWYAQAGREPEALQVLDQLLQMPRPLHLLIAGVYATLGDEDQAIGWLERGYRERNAGMVWLGRSEKDTRGSNPLLSLRSDPRFQDLLRRMHFPE